MQQTHTFFPGSQPALRGHRVILGISCAFLRIVGQAECIRDWLAENDNAHRVLHLQAQILVAPRSITGMECMVKAGARTCCIQYSAKRSIRGSFSTHGRCRSRSRTVLLAKQPIVCFRSRESNPMSTPCAWYGLKLWSLTQLRTIS